MIRFAPAVLPKVVQKIRRTLRMSVIMTLKITSSNVYQAPPGTQQSRIRNKIWITILKKLKQKKCSVVNTKTMPLVWAPGNY